MKLTNHLLALLLFILITGCGKEQGKDIKLAAAAFKAQLDAARQVDSVVQDAAAQQRLTIDEQSE